MGFRLWVIRVVFVASTPRPVILRNSPWKQTPSHRGFSARSMNVHDHSERSRCLYVSIVISGHYGACARRCKTSVMPTLTRVLIILCIGVAAILAWRSYGDAARAMIANSSPQLGWLAPQAALLAHNAPDMIGLQQFSFWEFGYGGRGCGIVPARV